MVAPLSRSEPIPAARFASRPRSAGSSALSRPRNAFPRDGVTPLSTTLDSIGPLANSVACCAIADAVMAGEPPTVPSAIPVEALRLGVAQTYVLDGLEGG
jgi:aspartyl-tRNA(Asn)/glutamyl-tRNA(Gln) amidotransferase subunit A